MTDRAAGMTDPPAPASPPRPVEPRIDLDLPAGLPARLAVAVSGGGDSTALLLLAADWARRTGRAVCAVTVDHGLRPEAAAEAAAVRELCRHRGIPHHLLRIHAPAPARGVQDWARRRRLAALAAWSRAEGGLPVMLAHTRDDQAETVLMRLRRGAGVAGLAAMRADRRHVLRDGDGVTGSLRLLRPLLAVSRQDLRRLLRARGVAWCEDPANADPRFERVRIRRLLRESGLDAAALATTAARMRQAEAALAAGGRRLGDGCCRWLPLGALEVDLAPLRAAESEFALRALAGALARVAPRPAPPRRRCLEAALAWALAADDAGAGRALAGCLLRRRGGDRLLLLREPAMCAPPLPLAGGEAGVWDGRWQVWYAGPGRVEVGALGRLPVAEAAAAAADWWQSPALARASVPAFRRGGRVIAVPGAGLRGPGAAAGAAFLTPAG